MGLCLFSIATDIVKEYLDLILVRIIQLAADAFSLAYLAVTLTTWEDYEPDHVERIESTRFVKSKSLRQRRLLTEKK